MAAGRGCFYFLRQKSDGSRNSLYLQELKKVTGISLLNCQDPLQGRFVDKMEGLRVLILHDTAVRGYRVESLNDLEFIYWGWSRPVQDMKFPFQLGKCRKLDMVMIRCNKIDLSLRVSTVF